MRKRHRPTVLALLVAAALLLPAAATATPSQPATGYPVGPLGLDRALLSNLSAPTIAPGASATLSFRLADPSWFGALSTIVATFELYALNGYPGDDVGSLPVANAPVLVSGAVSGLTVNVSLGSLAHGAAHAGAVTVTTDAATPAGTYAIRTALAFTENATHYLYESRGWFSAAAWAEATDGPNGSATINASSLGVSGILPETAILVSSSGWEWALGTLAAAGLLLVGLGAWLYFRRGPGSSSGVGHAAPDGERNAPSAFGSSRSSPGDSRSS